MRTRLALYTAAVALLVALQGPTAAQIPNQPAACGEYGTSIEFEDTPAEAARAARKAEKLVMVLHVSGHFEDPRFT